MADAMPDYKFEIMKKEYQLKQVELNVMQCEMRLVEIDGERARLQENIDSSAKAVKELQDDIDKMKEVHGG